MKIKDITETMYTGTMNDTKAAFEYVENTFYPSMEHIGDIENYHVYLARNNNIDIYGLVLDSELIGFASTSSADIGTILDNIYIKDSHRGKGLFPMFLIFLKRIAKIDRIILGSYHSDDAINAIKKIHHRFNTYWQNEHGDKITFDVKNISKFYSYDTPNEWRLVLEGDTSIEWPKFFMEGAISKWPIESMYYHTLLNGKDK